MLDMTSSGARVISHCKYCSFLLHIFINEKYQMMLIVGNKATSVSKYWIIWRV
jgi:hypothetical protein